MSRRHALTDAQWNQIQDLLPGKAGDPGETAADNRLFVDAILFVAKTGVSWRDLPERPGCDEHRILQRRLKACKEAWNGRVEELKEGHIEPPGEAQEAASLLQSLEEDAARFRSEGS